MAGLYTAAQAARSAGFTAARTGADCAPAFKAWARANGHDPRNSPLYPAWRDGFAGAHCPPIVRATRCATCCKAFALTPGGAIAEPFVTVIRGIAGTEHDAKQLVYCKPCHEKAQYKARLRRVQTEDLRGGLGGSWARLGAR